MGETCINHPDKAAAGQCAGCGRSFCHSCAMETPDGNLYCRSCAYSGAGVRKTGPGNMSILAFVLSIAGLGNCVTSIAGIVLGIIELRKIDRGESPEAGRKFARWAIIIGAVAFVLSVIYMILYAILMITGVG